MYMSFCRAVLIQLQQVPLCGLLEHQQTKVNLTVLTELYRVHRVTEVTEGALLSALHSIRKIVQLCVGLSLSVGLVQIA